MRYILLLIIILPILFILFEEDIRGDKSLQLDRVIRKTVKVSQEMIKEYIDDNKSSDIDSIKQATMRESLSRLDANIGDPIFIRVFKLTAELEVWIKTKGRYELLHNYEICMQSGYLGPKLKEGDRQGPEGFYYINKTRLNPNSKYHLSLNIGYPNSYDRAYDRTGSALMIHGDCLSVGCFAMTDEKIEEIYELVEEALNHGQKIVRVHIFPFRMSDKNMEHYRDHIWYDFWLNLKEGYDYFEKNSTPPKVYLKDHKYIFL